MIAEFLRNIAPHCTIETKQENHDYGFSIKIAKDVSWNYFLIFTDGLSNHKQQIPEHFEALKNREETGKISNNNPDNYSKYGAFSTIELYFCLPDYWDFKTEPWPLYWINILAGIPQKNDTWYGPGDTIPAGNPPETLSVRFPANHFMLTLPIKLDELFSHSIFKEKKIQFLGIIPILQEELDYKIRNSATVLMARLEKNKYTEQVDLYRQAVCRKRFLNFF